MTPATFREKLAAELDDQQVSTRALSKRLARRYGGNAEDRRRTLNRWLAGDSTPLPENRHLVEEELGLDRDSLKGEDDDDESSPFLLEANLLAELRRIVAEFTRKEALT